MITNENTFWRSRKRYFLNKILLASNGHTFSIMSNLVHTHLHKVCLFIFMYIFYGIES